MFIKTNGWLPNRDYADGQNRPADDIVILQGIAHQQNSQIRPGPSSHRNLLQRDDPTCIWETKQSGGESRIPKP